MRYNRHAEPYVILPADHPYVAQFDAAVGPYRDGWRVVWRDFGTTKQERFCASEAEAHAVADRLKRHADIIFSPDTLGMSVEEAERFWLT